MYHYRAFVGDVNKKALAVRGREKTVWNRRGLSKKIFDYGIDLFVSKAKGVFVISLKTSLPILADWYSAFFGRF